MVSCFAIIAAGFVEIYVVNDLRANQTTVFNEHVNKHLVAAAKISVFYQIPQYLLIGVGEVFASVGGMYGINYTQIRVKKNRYAQAYIFYHTHVKISQLVASLQTSCQQVVFAWLVTSCQQVWNKLLTTCNNLVDIIRFVTRLFQQGCYNHDMTILLQPCVVNLVTFLLYRDCIRLVGTIL